MLYYKGKNNLKLVPTAGVPLLIPALSYCQQSDFIRYSIAEFITIRRILVSDLVSNGWGPVRWGYTGARYSAMT